MSRYLRFTPFLLLLFFISCQKEGSFEQGSVSHGSLQNSAGDCLSKTVGGTYTATKALADSNYIDVNLDITQAGRYTVFTDTVNGYYFRATGTFSAAGSTTVRLKGYGTPAIAGVNDFTVFFDSSFCDVSVAVLPNGGSSGGTAVYTLDGSGGNCINFTPSGTFTQGVALTAANKVDIQVNVTKAGTWNITTSAAAGFSFTGSGTFTTTGIQTVTLNAIGTPNAAGTQIFNVAAGSSSCNFAITVKAGLTPPPNSGDYFPRTVNSHWTYMWDGDPTDTLRRYVIPATKTIGANTYAIIMENDGTTIDTSGYYRKSGSDYFLFGDVATDIGLDSAIYMEVTMLKDNQAAGYSWTSAPFTGTAGGTPVTARDQFTITQKDVTITSNGVSYPNTIVVKFEVQYNAGTSWISLPGYYLIYYTRNYGITKMEIFDGSGAAPDKLELIDYKVY